MLPQRLSDFCRQVSFFVSACAATTLTGLAATSRPNVLFIYTDDQAAWTVGAYGLYPDAHTPNIDRLAKEGARFTSAYSSSPVCSPARASLLTSRWSSETGVHDFIPNPGHVAYNDALGGMHLDPGVPTFPRIMADNGYHTGLVGKLHVGDWSQDPERKYHPTRYGYQYFMGLAGGGTSPKDPQLEENGRVQRIEGFCTDILTDRAVKFIEAQAGSGSPFLLSLHYRAPHGPWLPIGAVDSAPFEGKKMSVPFADYPELMQEAIKKKIPRYLASVHGVDRNLGVLMETLQRLGIDENTIVIFSSDNGYNVGQHALDGKGNAKWATRHRPGATPHIPEAYEPNLYSDSLQVPAIVRWPGRIAAGKRIATPFIDVDWYPTILGLTGIGVPANTTIRGQDMAPLLLGKASEDLGRPVYSEYDMKIYAQADLRGIQKDDWKLVVDFRNPWRAQLYNLKTDPLQRHNLIGDNSAEVLAARSALVNSLYDQMRAHNDYLLSRLPAPDAVEPGIKGNE